MNILCTYSYFKNLEETIHIDQKLLEIDLQ